MAKPKLILNRAVFGEAMSSPAMVAALTSEASGVISAVGGTVEPVVKYSEKARGNRVRLRVFTNMSYSAALRAAKGAGGSK